jgi:hypothetical protein
MNEKLSIRDWIYIAVLVGQIAVSSYRLGELEKRFSSFEVKYVTTEVFNLRLENLELRMDKHNMEPARPQAEVKPAQAAPAYPKIYGR